MLHVYHGNGKGKTTAAMGLALRFCGWGLPVLAVQFLKDGTSAEARELAMLPGVTLLHDEPPVTFTFRMTPEQRAASRATHDGNLRHAVEFARAHPEGLVVLDEALDALRAGLADEGLLRECALLASGRAEGPECVMTGREPAAWLLEAADYVTEMRACRHPYEHGVGARRGVEY